MTQRRQGLRLRLSRPGRRLLTQIVAMALVAGVVGGIALLAQYRTAYEQQRGRLLEIAQSQARLVEGIALHHEKLGLSEDPVVGFQVTLDELRAMHARFTGFGETGEFTFAELSEDRIVFLLSHRHSDMLTPSPLPMSGDLAEPMRRALSGESGTVVGPDYRGVQVLAAFEPVRVPGRTLAVVAKIDHAELRQPFLNTAGIVALAAILIIIIGSWIARRIGEPLIKDLEESEAKYRRLFEDSLEAVAHTSPEGTLIELNQAALDLFGVTREEIIGRDATEFYQDPGERERFRQEMERAGGVRDFHTKLLLPDGRLVDSALASAARHLPDGSLIYETVIRDVTDKQRAEEALRESEAQFRSLAESSPSAIYIEQGGRLVFVNAAGAALVGASEEELTSPDISWASLIDPDTMDVVMDAYHRHGAGEEVEPYEYRLIAMDGRRIDVVNATRLVTFQGESAVLGTVSDITAQKEIQARLRGERDRTQLYLDTAEVMLVALDSEGRIEMINRKGCEMLGWEEDELLGREWFETCIPEGTSREVRSAFFRIMGGELEPLEYYENEVVTKDGERRLMAWHNAYMRDAAGNAVGTLSSGEDVTELRLAQREVERSERQYRTIFEFSHDGHNLMRDGRFIEVNQRMQEVTGRTAEELLGMQPLEISPPFQPDGRPSKDKAEELLSEVMAGSPQLFEWMHQRVDGTLYPAEISLTRIDLEDGPAVFSIHRDLSERYEAQEALRQSEHQLQMIADLLPAYVARMDADRRFTFANRHYQELVGMPADEILGSDVHDVLGAETFQGIAPHLEKALQGVPASFEIVRPVGDEDERLLAAQYVPEVGREGKIAGVVALIQDITEDREAETRIRESEARFRTLFESTPLSAVHADLEGNIISCNRAFTRVHETADGPEAQVGRNVAEFFPQDQLTILQARIGAAIESADPIGPHQYTMLREDGRSFPAETYSAAIRDDAGQPLALVAHALDVTERKRSEEALAESERKFRLAFENASDAIVWAEVETGIIVNCNPAAERLFGRPQDELIGEHQTLLHPPETEDKSRQRFRDHVRAPEEVRGTQVITKSGEIREVLVSAAHIEVGGKQILQGVFTDITERIEAETALKESLQTSADIAESIPAGLFVYRYEAPETLTLAYANPECQVLTGIVPEEAVGKEFDEIWPNARSLGITESYLEVARTGEVLKLEEEAYKDDRLEGVFRTHVFRLPGERLAVSFENITERKKAEIALRESEERFRGVFQSGALGIALVGPEGKFFAANPTFRKMLGYSQEELTGLDPKEISHPDDAEPSRSLLKTLLEVGEPGFTIEKRYLDKWGEAVWCRLSASAVRDEAGSVLYGIGIFEDISERKAAQEELRESEQRFRILSDAAFEGIGVTKAGVVLEANDRLAEMLGWEREELIGRSINDSVAPSAREMVRERMAAGFEEPYEHMALKRDGTEFPIEVHGRPMPYRGETVRVTAIRDITARRKAEAELRETGERMRALAARLQEIREDERTSIARELHDELGQAITGLRMDLAMFKRDLPEEEEELHQRVDTMATLADENIVLVRSISSRLRPPVLDVLGLPAAVEWLVEEIEPRTELIFELDLQMDRVGLSRDASTAVFRIVQEALTNIVRHAEAERVRISMSLSAGNLVVDVHDDGVGISGAEVRYPRSLGLTGMHERAVALGGVLDIEKDPGGGTRVTLTVPMDAPDSNGGALE